MARLTICSALDAIFESDRLSCSREQAFSTWLEAIDHAVAA